MTQSEPKDKPIEFLSEDSMWQELANVGVTGNPGKAWDHRKWDVSDDRCWRLSLSSSQPGNYGSTNKVWEVKEVSFINKVSGARLTFDYRGVDFYGFAPGYGFIRLGKCIFPEPPDQDEPGESIYDA